jgi:hypothetical protein
MNHGKILKKVALISVAFDCPVPGNLTNMIYNLVAITVNNSYPLLTTHSDKISQNRFTLL